MNKDFFKNNWRKLDNVAKVFSMDNKNNTNMFRYSIILKEKINQNTLKKALLKTLETFKTYKVKLGSGLFWNYLEYNSKDPIVTKEDDIPCQHIKFKENNNYLFKVTYYKNKINLDIFHVLTDGVGSMKFLKSIVYNYLNIKHKLKYRPKENLEGNQIDYKDQYLKHYDKLYKIKNRFKTAYQLPGKINKNINNTYHYIIDLLQLKSICKGYQVTITEYITAVYIYSIYLSMYNKKSKKEIVITIPIDLRRFLQVDTLSNFFVCANINPKIRQKNLSTFEDILNQVHLEFKNKISKEKVKQYLTRDVGVGKNIMIRLVPLKVKKAIMQLVFDIASTTSTSTLSNVGIIDIEDKYKKYIDNVLILVMPSKKDKMKCSICSYEQKLNVTINSNFDDKNFEYTFLETLKKNIKNITLEGNTNLIK